MYKEKLLTLAIAKELICSSTCQEEIGSLLSENKIDWIKFKDFIIYHDLTPFAYLVLKNFGSFLPFELKDFLKNNYYCSLVRNQNIWQEFIRIFEALGKAGIIIVPIKGVALLKDIYTDKAIRQMTDIDLLIKAEDLKKAEGILCNLEYRKELYGLKEDYWRKNQYHITFYKRGNSGLPFVELHWDLDYKRKSRNMLPELWRRIRKIKSDGKIIELLSPEDTFFSLALHNRRLGRTLCLKSAYDAALILKKYAADFDWDYVLKGSQEGKMNATIFFLLSQMRLFSDSNIPKAVWKKLNIPFWKKRLIFQFIANNSFLPQQNIQGKSLYLKTHFLIYDSFWEPIEYILNIPLEQFAKFYGIDTYDEKTLLIYKRRLFYMPIKFIKDKLNVDLL